MGFYSLLYSVNKVISRLHILTGNPLTFKVLKNGVEVKLQRNALSVLEHPTGHEEDDDHDYDISSSSSDIGEKDNDFCKLHHV
jgi:hypothetical protein